MEKIRKRDTCFKAADKVNDNCQNQQIADNLAPQVKYGPDDKSLCLNKKKKDEITKCQNRSRDEGPRPRRTYSEVGNRTGK